MSFRTFLGKKSKHLGLFKYWQQIEKQLYPNIELIIGEFLSDFTGSVNMETLDDKVIEVHLRMGDIDLVDKDIIKLALYNIMNLDDETINSQLKIINSKKRKFIYLIPVWETMDKFCLETAYNQVQEKADAMDGELKEKFISYPIPKQIIEEYKKSI